MMSLNNYLKIKKKVLETITRGKYMACNKLAFQITKTLQECTYWHLFQFVDIIKRILTTSKLIIETIKVQMLGLYFIVISTNL